MSVMNGQVKVTLEMTGKGDAPAKAKETTGALEKMKGAADGAGDSATSLKDRLGAIKQAASPVNFLRETFENLSSNGGFLIGTLGGVAGAVAGVVGAIIDYVSEADRGAAATKQWEKDLEGFNGAIERAWDVLDKSASDPVVDALADVNIELFKAKLTLADIAKGTQEWWDKTRQIRNMEEARTHLEADIARDMERSRDAIAKLFDTMRDIHALGPVQVFRGSSRDDDMKVKPNAFGEYETDAERIAREKRLADAIKNNKPRSGGGGGKRKLSPSEVEALLGGPTNSDGLDEFWSRFENTASAGSPNANTAGLSDGAGTGERGKSRMQMLAGDVRDFTASLSESIPEMDAFSSALGAISQMWGEYAETGKGAARATIMSVGAIAMAGAEQIKNERLRAGVLSIIHLGLGTALMFVPGQQQEALGHLAGAAILGSVAIFGGSSSGGGKSSPGSSRSVVRPLSDARQGSGGINITINGDWHGQSSPQETAAALHARINAGRSSGYVPARAA